MSGYAFGVAFGAPLVAIATSRLPRKAALLALMAIFILGNLGCAFAPSYALLMVARVLTAFAHGAFFGIGSVVARDLVAAEEESAGGGDHVLGPDARQRARRALRHRPGAGDGLALSRSSS